MNKKAVFSISLALLLLAMVSTITLAAPTIDPQLNDAIAFAEAVNLPGWLGGLMAILSILLPVGLFQWMRQNEG